MIVRMKLVTPSMGELELSEQHEPELFQMAKVGLGVCGLFFLCFQIPKINKIADAKHSQTDNATKGER